MNAYTEQFAASCGYIGTSPAMLNAFEEIRQSGICAARKMHHDRKKLVDSFKHHPMMLDGYLNQFRPSPFASLSEAVEFWRNEVEHQQTLREAGHWRFNGAKLRIAAERLIVARYFRMYGQRIWQRRAA